MRLLLIVLLGVVFFGGNACSSFNSGKQVASEASTSNADLNAQGPRRPADSQEQNASLDQADATNVVNQAIERKIVRNASLTVEVVSPTESQRKIVSIAESHQGFVVASEATQSSTGDKSKTETTVNLVVRVPAAQFNQVMEEIRAVGMRVSQEKVTGQDVTEEFIDLEARIKNQKALEFQFIEIMKQAGKVEDALQVQRELANVRTEIEKLEGRRRFLQNQASLSTITVKLQPPTQIVNAAGFWFSVKSAFSDGFDVAMAIILFLIRAIIGLLPIVILVVLPAALIVRFIIKRVLRARPDRKDIEGVKLAE